MRKKVNHQFRKDNDGGGGGEPIKADKGLITRRQGPHVNLQPGKFSKCFFSPSRQFKNFPNNRGRRTN